jgi:hypothetical protein
MRLLSHRQDEQGTPYELGIVLPAKALHREKAIDSIRQQISSLESGVTIIGSGLPIPPLGRIDLVGEDHDGHLVAASVCDLLDARELAAALMRADWMRDNRELLERLYARPLSGNRIRVWQFASRVASEALALLRRLPEHDVELFQYEHVELVGRPCLLLRRQEPAADRPPPKVADLSEREHPVLEPADSGAPSLHAILTKEEIDDFFLEPSGVT